MTPEPKPSRRSEQVLAVSVLGGESNENTLTLLPSLSLLPNSTEGQMTPLMFVIGFQSLHMVPLFAVKVKE